MNPSFYIIFIILLVLLIQQRNRNLWLQQRIQKRKTEDRAKMLELATRFLEKECIIYTFNHQITGTIREVSEGAILLESSDSLEAVNLDFVVRIREYPRKKNGKKKAIVAD